MKYLKKYNEVQDINLLDKDIKETVEQILYEVEDEGFTTRLEYDVRKIPAPSLIVNRNAIRRESIEENLIIEICYPTNFSYELIESCIERLKTYLPMKGFKLAGHSNPKVLRTRIPSLYKYWYHKINFAKTTTI